MSTYQLNKKKVIFRALVMLAIGISAIVGASQIDRIRELLTKASGEPANIIINTQVVLGNHRRSWRNLAQGGENSNWSIAPLSAKVSALQPEYIRLDHIYDFYEIAQGSPGNLSFNFAKLDTIINEILAVGAKPYISLSYMPPAISKGDIVDAPHQWTDWQLVVQKTIEHVSGTRQIENVYYEVWNEPDLFGGWRYWGQKNYLTMYSYAAAGARNAQQNKDVKNFFLGGPATTALYRNWFDALAKHAISNNLKFDFFSWHRYSHSLDIYQKDLEEVRSWLARYPQLSTLELHVTEWGPDSDNHPGYDTAYGAAHVVAGAITLNQLVDRAFVFEIEDGKSPTNQPFWGRWGLLTHQSHGAQIKPRYQGLKMLDRISPQRLPISGQGSWVKAIASRTETGNTQVVMANADVDARNSELVPVTFENIEPGNYLFQMEYLDGRVQNTQTATTSAILRVEVPMPPNSVMMGELSKVE
ncbi:MAG TPA: glycosyl hydrolase [Candidatus Woesebacteria bacterium]|nr:glycosyl hydrolase [Candidatus Woesebacteria bacterium]